MTMHLVLGDGEMTRKELLSTLNDLWTSAEGDSFWFIVQGKSNPTDTDQAIVNWLAKNNIYFEVVTDVPDAMDDIYDDAQATHSAKKLSTKVIDLLNTSPEDGEDAKVLSLFVSNDETVEEDRWLASILEVVCDNGFPVFALNDGMIELEFGADANAEEEEEEEAPAPTPRAGASKKTAAAVVEDDEDEEEEEEGAVAEYTREQLEELALPALKKIATGMGIELPPRTRITTYVDRILGEAEAEAEEEAEVEVIEPALDLDMDTIVEMVIAAIVERLQS